MKADNVEFPGKHNSNEYNEEDTQKLPVLKHRGITGTLEKDSFTIDSFNTVADDGTTLEEVSLANLDEAGADDQIDIPANDATPTPELINGKDESGATKEVPSPPIVEEDAPHFVQPLQQPQQARPIISRGRAILFAALLVIVVLNAINLGSTQFLGSQGWAYVLGGPATNGNKNPLDTVNTILHHTTPSPGVKGKQKLTPAQYINLLIQNMTPDQKLGQMMIVQFYGPSYSLDISTMISQYNVGAVLLFGTNDNIQSKPQLKGLIQQMKSNSTIPLTVAIDQEGGTVDRLVNLDGPRPSATSI